MEWEVTDPNVITWTCVQTFSGLTDSIETKDAAQVKGEPDNYWVVCTPKSGARSVRLKLQRFPLL